MSNKPAPTRTTGEAVRSLFSKETLPMLIAQGVPGKLLPVGTLLLGLILGFLWAYTIAPNVYTAAEPVNLGQSWKNEYIKQTAWQYASSQDAEAARRQLGSLGDAQTVLNRMLANETDATLTSLLRNIEPLAIDNPDQLAKIQPSLLNSNLTPVLCVLAVVLLIGLPVLLNVFIPFRVLFARQSKDENASAQGQEADRRRAVKEAQEKAKTAAPAAVAQNLGDPVAKYVTSYVLGDDLYDDSFSIENADNVFFGEMGVGISKTIGEGDPKKVAAIEVWVFDKDDTRTLTSVLASEYAYNDEALRAELGAKGKVYLAEPGNVMQMETQSLIVSFRAVDLAYGSGALPDKSFFDRLSVEVTAYRKQGGGSGGSTAPSLSPADPLGQTNPVSPISLR